MSTALQLKRGYRSTERGTHQPEDFREVGAEDFPQAEEGDSREDIPHVTSQWLPWPREAFLPAIHILIFRTLWTLKKMDHGINTSSNEQWFTGLY